MQIRVISSLQNFCDILDKSPSFNRLRKFCISPAAPPELKSRNLRVNSFVKLLMDGNAVVTELAMCVDLDLKSVRSKEEQGGKLKDVQELLG